MYHKKLKEKILPLIFSLLFVVGIVTLMVRAAIPVNLYLAPSNRFGTVGSSFSVAIRVTTQGNPIDYVRAYLTFPTDKLGVAGISAAGSSFDYQLETTVSGNQIKIGRYSTTGVKNDDMLVATITFNVLNSGTAQVAYEAGSGGYNTTTGSNQPTSTTSGGSYTLTAPPASPTPPPASPPTHPPGPPSTPPTPPGTPPIISRPGMPPGTTPGASPSSPGASPQPGTPPLIDESFIPVSDPNNQSAYYPVLITIKDHKGRPAAGVEVEASNLHLITNDMGSVSLSFPAGQQTVVVKSAKVSKQYIINVEPKVPDDSTPQVIQEFNLTLPNPGLNVVRSLKIGFSIILAALGVGLLWLLSRRLRLRPRIPKTHPTVSPAALPAPPKPLEPLQELPLPVDEPLPVVTLPHAASAKTHAQAADSPRSKHEVEVAALALHPHDTAKTLQPLSRSASGATNHSPTSEAVPTEAHPTVAKPASQPAAAHSKPVPPKPAPPPVDPYKPDGEPKDIFEMAEERFEHDDRLKNLRKPEN